jgi:hypothetical protein
VIAKNKDEYDNMEHYARIIQENQYDLGLPISSFDSIGRSASRFLWENIRKKIIFKKKKHQMMKNIQLTDTNKKDSLIHIVNILKMMRIKQIGSLMIIVKISQINLLHRER